MWIHSYFELTHFGADTPLSLLCSAVLLLLACLFAQTLCVTVLGPCPLGLASWFRGWHHMELGVLLHSSCLWHVSPLGRMWKVRSSAIVTKKYF